MSASRSPGVLRTSTKVISNVGNATRTLLSETVLRIFPSGASSCQTTIDSRNERAGNTELQIKRSPQKSTIRTDALIRRCVCSSIAESFIWFTSSRSVVAPEASAWFFIATFSLSCRNAIRLFDTRSHRSAIPCSTAVATTSQIV